MKGGGGTEHGFSALKLKSYRDWEWDNHEMRKKGNTNTTVNSCLIEWKPLLKVLYLC